VRENTRATGASILLGVDGLFLGALLFIAMSVRSGHVKWLRSLGVAGPGWPDVGGGPGAVLPWAAAGATALAFVLCRRPVPPIAPFLAALGAVGATAVALRRMADAGASFGSGRYGTVSHVLAGVLVLHLLGAMVALGRGARPARFLALQALYAAGLAALVYPA
jgi:hypothetical protein